jgi:LPS export ABC transporter protein LptC
VAFLFAAGMALSACRPSAEEANASPSAAEVPSQILKHFEMNDIQNGLKTMTLNSPEGRIYESKQVADVDQPVIYFYKNGHETSRLTAPSGTVKTDTHEVEAWGGVTIVTTDSSTLTTDRLRFDPKTQKIYSKDAVHLDKPDSVTDGVGLETDPGLKKIKIGHQIVKFKKGMRP